MDPAIFFITDRLYSIRETASAPTWAEAMLSRLIKPLRNFGSAIDGSIASIFSLALIPIIAFVGTVVDYSLANAIKTAMPSTRDLAGPMLQRTVRALSVDQLQSDPNYKYQLAIVLPPDGLNARDFRHTSRPQIDVRQNMTWDGIKTAAITLYPMQVGTGGDRTTTLLQNSTSNLPETTDHYFLLKAANEIVTTFSHNSTNLPQSYLEK
jgi:hypothetical protein